MNETFKHPELPPQPSVPLYDNAGRYWVRVWPIGDWFCEADNWTAEWHDLLTYYGPMTTEPPS